MVFEKSNKRLPIRWLKNKNPHLMHKSVRYIFCFVQNNEVLMALFPVPLFLVWTVHRKIMFKNE